MATTLNTYYIHPNGTQKLVYDAVNPGASAQSVFDRMSGPTAPYAVYWCDNEGEKFLVWQKEIQELGQYYFWGVEGNWDEDEWELYGDLKVLLDTRIVDGVSEEDLIGNNVPTNFRMTKTYVGEIINNENLTPINGYIVVISDGIKPGLKRANNTTEGTWEKVKVFTDVNGKQHTVWCFPYRDSGRSVTRYKNLEIK